MSKKHADQILATLDVLQTDEGRSYAFSYLAGVLSAKAEAGKPVSATALATAVANAVESASKSRAEEKAREEEQAWRTAAETELPDPREARYGDAELDGTRCISCHEDFAVGEASIPAGVVDGAGMVFAHHACLFVRVPTPELTALRPLPVVSTPEGTRRGDDKIEGTGAEPSLALLAEQEFITEQAEAIIEEWVPKSTRESGADPYYSGDYVTMFGDDE